MKAAAPRVPTDGDIVRRVKLCGVSKGGKLLRPWSECPEVDALIDTGATITIISRTLAKLAGAQIVSGSQILHGRSHDGALLAVKLDAPGCGQSTLFVVVDDRAAATAGPRAFMLIGHDYLQNNHARIDYGDTDLVRCPPRRGTGRRRKP